MTATYVYFALHEPTGLVKIGHSMRPHERAENVFMFGKRVVTRLLCMVPGDRIVEAEFHLRFAAHARRDAGEEWFQYVPLSKEIAALAISRVAQLSILAHAARSPHFYRYSVKTFGGWKRFCAAAGWPSAITWQVRDQSPWARTSPARSVR